MSGWEPVVILKTSETVKDVYHGITPEGLTRCGRPLSVDAEVRWRWRLEGWHWTRPCLRCFPASNTGSDRSQESSQEDDA